jgi:hypothetical protein|tara:strand:+ start:11065 stop:12312 length:1248 start_codon:yes stop_codon:yes gene_type:complete
MALACNIKPLSAFLSTNLNNKIKTYDNLGDRIKRSLGYPLISLEIHTDQLRQNIQLAVEYYTKYAGYTREFLIFDSNMYEQNRGIRLDFLYTLANDNIDTRLQKTDGTNPLGPGPEFYGSQSPTILSGGNRSDGVAPGTGGNYTRTNASVYVAMSTLSAGAFSDSVNLSSTFAYTTAGRGPGIQAFELFDRSLYQDITAYRPTLSSFFKATPKQTVTFEGKETEAYYYQNVFDYDVMEYRKVVDVIDFEEGSTTGINTLFTLEQTLAQQTYFSYALGNYGFDLVSWYTLKEWIDTREKLLATRRDIKFDPRTQYMQMYPQPGGDRFYGVLGCYLERPIRDVIMEQWVYEYSLALSQITIGRVRGKFGNVQLLGGGSLNYDMLTEGLERKAELEAKLFEGASPGFGDTEPPMFFVG